MALIKCIECGKEFSDKASACPNCGCPTEIVVKELNSTSEKGEIIATYNILGYDFAIDEKDKRLITVVKGLREGRNEIEENVTSLYYTFKNIDGLITGLPEIYSQLLEAMVTSAISILIDNGIYNCDIDSFMGKYGASLDVESLMEPIVSLYLEIQNFETEAILYREYVRQHRLHTWSGGGFGVKGALKGYFKAQLLNVGTEFLNLHSDNVNHRKNMAEVAKAKRMLYQDKATKNLVINSLMNVYDTCFRAAIQELVNAGKFPKSLFNEEEATCIYNNILTTYASGNYNIEIIKEQCLKVFQADPAHQDVIEMIINMEKTPEKSDIVRYAKDFDFYERYLSNKQSMLEEVYQDKIYELTYTDIATNVLFEDALKQCIELKEEGLNIGEIFKKVCYSRSKYPVSSKDFQELSQWIVSDTSGLSDVEIRQFKEIFENIELDETDPDEINGIVKYYCFDYALKQKENIHFLYDYRTSIRNNKKYEDFQIFCELPQDAYIYVAYSTYRTDNPELIILVTDKGLYIYEGNFDDQKFWNWKDYANSEVSISYHKLTIGNGKYNFYCNDELEKLFLGLHAEMYAYFTTGKSQYLQEREQYEACYEACTEKKSLSEEDLKCIRDFDFNSFVRNFCVKKAEEDEEYSNELYVSNSNESSVGGFTVFWTCNNTNVDIRKYWIRYKEIFEFEDDVELYAMDAELRYAGKYEYATLFTSRGLFFYQNDNGNTSLLYCEWKDLPICSYYVRDSFSQPKLVINGEKCDIGKRATHLFIDLRYSLRKYLLENNRVYRRLDNVDRLTPNMEKKIWEICRSFSPGPLLTEFHYFHHFLLYESDKKKENYCAPKDDLAYLYDRVDLRIPEEDEVYYMLARNLEEIYSRREGENLIRLGFYITNSGIYWYDRTRGRGHKEWDYFDNVELKLKLDEGIFIDNDFVYLKEESGFVYKILKKIQNYISSLGDIVIIEPRMESFTPGKWDNDCLSPILSNRQNIKLYTCSDCFLPDAVREHAPELEDIFITENSRSFYAIGDLYQLICFTDTNTAILVASEMLLIKNSGGVLAIRYNSIKKLELGKKENGDSCLFIYVTNGINISKHYIEIGADCLDVDLSPIYKALEEKCGYNHAKILETETDIGDNKAERDENTHNPDNVELAKDKRVRAAEIFDCSASGDFASEFCHKAFSMLCTCLNTYEKVDDILEILDSLAENTDCCATRKVNKGLLYKAANRAGAQYIDSDEFPLFYKDSAIMLYGKNGLLITNKAVIRIKKNSVRKTLISQIHSIHLTSLITTDEYCRWSFNCDNEIDLDKIGITPEQSGIIMSLICILYDETNHRDKIHFFNSL